MQIWLMKTAHQWVLFDMENYLMLSNGPNKGWLALFDHWIKLYGAKHQFEHLKRIDRPDVIFHDDILSWIERIRQEFKNERD